MKKFLSLATAVILLSAFNIQDTLNGTWEYAGGITKGTFYPAPKTYKMHRVYSDKQFEAFMLEEGEPPVKYESGDYLLKPDSCLETQTFSLQGQHMIGKTTRYQRNMRHDTLVLKGILPNGAAIEDYWKRIK